MKKQNGNIDKETTVQPGSVDDYFAEKQDRITFKIKFKNF